MFNDLWKKNYIKLLSISIENKKITPLQVGDIVLIPDALKSRLNWTKAVIEKTFPGTDGVVRVVNVRTRLGSYKRAVKGMVLLEVAAPRPVCYGT